jgi:D-glycero-D-manno-heptose 1,7-bisphosphate phosphatase
MTRPAIFFDRDNTLIIGNDYLGDPAKVVLIAGAADAVARARVMGYATVVVSNQSGVARGMFGEDDVHAVNTRMDEMLRAENDQAIIDRHEFCPFHPQAPVEKYRLDSDRRKPRPGMLLAAAKEMDLDLAASWIIGDAARDVEAGKRAGCRAVLFTDRTLPASPAAQATPRVPPDFVASSLKDAMDHIEAARAEAAPNSSAAEKHAPAAVTTPELTPVRSPVEAPAQMHLDPPVEASVAASLARIPRAASDDLPAESSEPPDLLSATEPTGSPMPAVSSSPSLPLEESLGGNRLEKLAEQILHEVRRHHEVHHSDFSVSKLLAGIVQVIAVAVMFLAYLNRDSTGLEAIMLLAIFLQAMTCSLLIMSGQK